MFEVPIKLFSFTYISVSDVGQWNMYDLVSETLANTQIGTSQTFLTWCCAKVLILQKSAYS